VKIGVVTGDIAALAIGTFDGPEIDDLIGPQAVALLVLLLASLQVLEMGVGSNINFVPLITLQRHLIALLKFSPVESWFCSCKRRGKATFDTPINPYARSACSRSVAVGITGP
jgi:hypothetical protein